MAKSADAFRTISEVAEWLGSPAHVLRFWESKFTQVKPVKRAGGRRYYRPADMLLLGGIKKLLHDDGMTIKGVQKVLREQGVKHVASLSHPLEESDAEAPFEADVEPTPSDDTDSGQVLQFQRDDDATGAGSAAEAPIAEPEAPKAPDGTQEQVAAKAENSPDAPAVDGAPASDTRVLEDFAAGSDTDPAPFDQEPVAAKEEEPPAPLADTAATPEPELETVPPAETKEPVVTPDAATLPAFLHRAPAAPISEEAPSETAAPISEPAAESEVTADVEPPAPRPDIISLPDDPADDAIDAPSGLLTLIARQKGTLSPAVLAKISAERDKLAAFIAR